MNEQKLLQQIETGRLAQDVLDNPVFKSVAEQIREDFNRAFRGDDEDEALKVRREARAFEKILTKLAMLKDKGDAADSSLRELKRRERAGEPTDLNSMHGIA